MTRPYSTFALVAVCAACCWTVAASDVRAAGVGPADKPAGAVQNLVWHGDYGAALRRAESEQKLLVVYFQPVQTGDGKSGDAADNLRNAFEQQTLADAAVVRALGGCVLARLPLVVKIRTAGREIRLIDHAAFAQAEGRPGLVVIDAAHRESPWFKHVVDAVPLGDARLAKADQLASLLAERSDVAAPAESPAQAAAQATAEAAPPAPLNWQTDYAKAMRTAEAERKSLLILFQEPQPDARASRFERRTLGNGTIRRKLARFVLAKLPTTSTIQSQGKSVRLLDHEAFEYMYGRPGMAIIDVANKDAEYYKHVVSAFPMSDRREYDAEQTGAILDLPPGTLTQRTLIFAVRTHEESPASTEGKFDKILAQEAESHSQYQADINLQGHHNWDQRFHRITSRLPDSMAAVEVCAESWPGEELVDAACECVHSWRQSSGHWSAVREWHPLYGYDIKLGSGRVWYATGIFARR